ncbi:MAG: hypothetical protein CM15mP120_08890 [Pseudomonadota bacterium]|nr:MAG: hypothetical protein CM15mP120_08890 [Pseudomonadota bacterium]
MGVTLGTMFANLIGGWVTDVFDWRTAFFVVGLPGVLIAAVFKLTVKEPPRATPTLRARSQNNRWKCARRFAN